MNGAIPIVLSICLLTVTGCAATTYSHRGGDNRVSDAVGEPFRDTGWTRENPPEVLIRAAEAPYALPSDIACIAILNEISALDLVLGPDLDTADERWRTRAACRRSGDTTTITSGRTAPRRSERRPRGRLEPPMTALARMAEPGATKHRKQDRANMS